MVDINQILLTFLLSVLVYSNMTAPDRYCLGNCANCHPSNIFKCIGNSPCEWGYYDPNANGHCQLQPSLSLAYAQLEQKTYYGSIKKYQNWGTDSKVTNCKYMSMGLKNTVQVLGLFQGSQSIQREFRVRRGIQLVDISFSLVRDDWLPFSDFLVLEIANGGNILKNFQISYESKLNIQDQTINITCDGRRVILQKFRIRINEILQNETFSITFSSYLYSSVWGITNFKVITGCSAFTAINSTSGSCQICDPNSYFVQIANGFGICKTCPNFCQSCLNQSICLSCKWGSLQNGICEIPSNYKLQQLQLGYTLSICGSYSMVMGSKDKKIILPIFRNKNNSVYGKIVLSLIGYYDPFEITDQSKTKPSIKININGQNILNYDIPQKTNTTTDGCSLFASGAMARAVIVGTQIEINDSKAQITLQMSGIQNFGIAEVSLYSLSQYSFIKPTTVTALINTQSKISSDVADSVDRSNELPNVIISAQSPLNNIYNLVKLSGSQQTVVQSAILGRLKLQNLGQPISKNVRYAVQSDGNLHFSIVNFPNPLTGQLFVQIDKLTPNTYQIINSYVEGNNLLVVLNIKASFSNGRVSFKEISTSRFLQPGSKNVIGSTNLIASFVVQRYDAITGSQLQSIQFFRRIFQAFAWLGLIGVVLAVLSGFGIVLEDYLISLQMLYLHVFIGYDLLPMSCRQVISGLRGIANLDYFLPTSTISNAWSLNSENIYWFLPGDYNFLLAFLPILTALLCYSLWFVALIALKKWVLPRDIHDSQRTKFHKIVDNIVCRVVNFIDTIWRYQLIPVILISFKQFIDFRYQTHSYIGQLFFSILIFLLYLGWSAFTEIYVRSQYYQNQYSYFLFKFQDRYFCKISQHSLPTRHHRIGYPLIRVAKALASVIFIMLINKPLLVLVLLIITNCFELWYIIINSIYSDPKMLKFKLIQSALLITIQIIMVVLSAGSTFFAGPTYLDLGFSVSGLGALIVLNSVIRLGFVAWLKYVQMKGVHFEQVQLDQKKIENQRVV